MVTHLAPSVVNTLTRPDPARVYRTCTKRISLESSLKELSFKTITKSMGVSMKELWTEMCVLNKWYQRPFLNLRCGISKSIELPNFHNTTCSRDMQATVSIVTL